MFPIDTLNIFYCSKRQKDKTQVKQLRQSSPIDVLRFSEFRTMRNHLSETLMLNDIQITSDYMSRWVVLKRRVGAVTSQRVLKVLFYVNIMQCFFEL